MARRKKKPVKLTDKEEATLRAIEELGETADMGDLQKRANEILEEIRAKRRKKLH
jgi:hypothetical protein